MTTDTPSPTESERPAPPAESPPPAAEQPDTQLLLLKDKVQRYLTDLAGMIQIAPNGMFTLQMGSARVFIDCTAWRQTGKTLVSVQSPVLIDCVPSAELYEHIATHANDYLFGHLSADPQTDGSVIVMFTHTLLGDYLDPDELKTAVLGVLSTVDQIDEDMKARFGGKRFQEGPS